MGIFLFYTLVVTIGSYCYSYPCSGQSCNIGYACDRSCESTYSCRGSSCRDSHSCCVPSSCTKFRTCEIECCKSRSCCESSCCNCPCPPPTPTTTTSQRPFTPPRPPPEPFRPTIYPPPYYPPSGNRSDVTVTHNNNNNSVIIPTNITIQNDVNSETRISIPVNISVSNVNNIQISSALSGNTTTGERTREKECNTSVIGVNQTIPFPVPVPVPVPVPYVVRIPYPQPVPTGCCQIVQPCVPYHYCGCQTTNMHCSHQCVQPYMYQPINVCQMGCHKRDFAVGQHCSHGGCYQGQVHCSSCHSNFYNNYDSFLRCSECFTPTQWG